MTTALSVLIGLIVVPEAAGAAEHRPAAAAHELVAGEVVGSPQMVSLTPDNLGIAMWSSPDGTTLINVSREVDGSKVSDLAFTDGATSSDMPGLRVPGEVRDVSFGPYSTAYLTVAHPDEQTAGWLLRLGRADSSATVLHTWPVDPVERYRGPYSVEYANDRLFVEALSANTIHSCLPQLEAFDLAGASVGTFEATTCGGLWQADDGLVFASDAESYGGLFVDPATGESHRVGFPSPGPIWNIAHGPGGRIAVVTGNGHNRCETGAVSVIDPSGMLVSRPLHEVFGVASDAQCLVRALTLLDNGAAVVGADLLGIGAALFVLAPDGSSKRIWTSASETIRSLQAAAGNAFVMVSTSADACGLPHLEDCGRVHISAGTDAAVTRLASFGGDYGDSRTAPFQLVSIGHGDVVVVSQRNQCLCADPDNEYLLDRVVAPEIGRQSWHDPAGGVLPPPPPDDQPPQWSTPTPADGSRFDLLPGTIGTFHLNATDPDGEVVTITRRFLEPDGDVRSQPSYVTCKDDTNPAPTAHVFCSVAPKANGLAVMEVDATDPDGDSAGTRRFLVSGSPYKYVALGDSFSAGEGVDPYFKDGWDLGSRTQPGNLDSRCHRSTRAYAEYVQPSSFLQPLYVLASGNVNPGTGGNENKYGSNLNTRTRGNIAWGLLACSGAKTSNVLPVADGGATPAPDRDYRELYTQLDNPFVNFGTDLVTITIGGNDIGFGDVLAHCATNACNTPDYRADLEQAIDRIEPSLTRVYEAVKLKTFNARVIVLGYPQVFPASAAEQGCKKLGLFRGEMGMLRDLGSRLNGVIAAAAAAAGVQFEDVAGDFAGHEVCGARGEWINGYSTSKKSKRDDESFHPNLDGQQGYLLALQSALTK